MTEEIMRAQWGEIADPKAWIMTEDDGRVNIIPFLSKEDAQKYSKNVLNKWHSHTIITELSVIKELGEHYLISPDDYLFLPKFEDMKKEKIIVDDEDVYVECPHCGHGESHPIDEQRHHIQTFDIIEWTNEDTSRMQCHSCKGKFLLLWDYTNLFPNEDE